MRTGRIVLVKRSFFSFSLAAQDCIILRDNVYNVQTYHDLTYNVMSATNYV